MYFMNNTFRACLYMFCLPIVIIAVFLLLNRKKMKELEMDLFNPFSSMMLLIVYLALMCLVGLFVRFTCLDYNTVDSKVVESSVSITSVNLNSDPSISGSGSFILGSGSISIDSSIENYFYYYVKDENNRYRLDKINAETVLLEESNEREPSIVTFDTYEVVATIPTTFGKILGFKEESNEHLNSYLTETVMYIPEGSIVKDYNPNMN